MGMDNLQMSAIVPPLIELQHVSIVRNGREILHDLKLRVEDGEHVAIMGPNGSGKSTLIKTIMRELYPLYRPGCSMQLFGQETWNVAELRSLLGIVQNEVTPFCARPITGYDAVLSGFFSSVGVARHHKVKESMREKTVELMRWLEIAHLADRPVAEMSSG